MRQRAPHFRASLWVPPPYPPQLVDLECTVVPHRRTFTHHGENITSDFYFAGLLHFCHVTHIWTCHKITSVQQWKCENVIVMECQWFIPLALWFEFDWVNRCRVSNILCMVSQAENKVQSHPKILMCKKIYAFKAKWKLENWAQMK